MICPICNEFTMTERVELNEVTYNNRYGKIEMEYSNCPQCGDQSDAEQIKRNKERMIKFKETVDVWSGDNTNG